VIDFLDGAWMRRSPRVALKRVKECIPPGHQCEEALPMRDARRPQKDRLVADKSYDLSGTERRKRNQA